MSQREMPMTVAGTQVLTDPGFEDGSAPAGWTASGLNLPFLKNPAWAHSGAWSALLTANASGTLTSLPFTVPAATGSVFAIPRPSYPPSKPAESNSGLGKRKDNP